MGTVLICCTVSGTVDTVVMSLWGMEGKALGHGVGCLVLGLTGWADIYTTCELIHSLRVCSLPKTNPENQRVFLLSQCQNRILGSGLKLEFCRVRFWGGVPLLEMELEERFEMSGSGPGSE